MEGMEKALNNQEELSGFIFMCNGMTKPECYRFRVFGLPAGRKEVVEKIQPGTYLFLFDYDLKLLYGIYTATSTGKLRIEQSAFGGKFPAQVSFKIYKECLPLPENCFKHAIQDNYQKDCNKFSPELNLRQVRSLLSLFRPLSVLSTAPMQPVLMNTCPPTVMPLTPVNNGFHQRRPSLPEYTYLTRMSWSHNQVRRQLNFKHVNELMESAGHAVNEQIMMPNSAPAQSMLSQASRKELHHPAWPNLVENTYSAGRSNSYTELLPDPQGTYQNMLNPQPEFHSSINVMGASHAQSLPDPQHTYQSPQSDFHYSMVNMGSSYTESLQHPQHTHRNILYPETDFYSPMVNMGNSHAQSLPHFQHIHQNILNPQPDFHSFMQSHASSLSNYPISFWRNWVPYFPQEVVSSASASYSYQGSGAVQGIISSDQQVGMGNEYYGLSSWTGNNIAPQENAVEHILCPVSAYSYTQPASQSRIQL